MSITDSLLKVSEVAELLNLGESTVWKMTQDGRIKYVRFPAKPGGKKGGAIRILSAEVFRILAIIEPKSMQRF
jgi:excisionase family DNA binding protein